MSEVELHPAHVWTCEECGRDNFCRGVVAEFDSEDRAEFVETFGEKPLPGFWMTAPTEVTCGHCGVEFVTKDMHGM